MIVLRWFFFLLLHLSVCHSAYPQQPSWRLWSSGLPTGVYPRMAVAPNHDIFYALLGAGTHLGLVYKANTLSDHGDFHPLPQIPRPVSIQNNIVALGYNRFGAPLVGIYRSDTAEPWLFRFDSASMQWDTVIADATPTLGGHCMATAGDGTIYLGARWAYVYVSHDDGASFHAIDESAILAADYPCFYPTWNGSAYDGAIFGIQVDSSGRVYAGTETAGVIYSDDRGLHWHPADLFACRPDDPQVYDTLSPMIALSMGGNVAGLGFTKDQQLVWSGADMWTLGWRNKLGIADFSQGVVHEAHGLPDYLIQTGQQVSRIVTTDSGRMFFHSGNSNGATGVGIYTSTDGINWEAFNTGITGLNDGLSQGSLAVDGNRVFMATRDGQVWMYEDSTVITAVSDRIADTHQIEISPNPAKASITLEGLPLDNASHPSIFILDGMGQFVRRIPFRDPGNTEFDISDLSPGLYVVMIKMPSQHLVSGRFVKI